MDQFYDLPHYLPGGSAVKNLPAMQETSRRHGFNPWVRKIPGFLLGKFHVLRSLAGCGPWGHKELDATEYTDTYIHTPF